MTSVKKEVERGTINGSSFRPHISVMGCTHYRVRILQPPIVQEDTGRYLSGYYDVHESEMRSINLYNGVALIVDKQPSHSRRTVLYRVLAAALESLQMNNTYIPDFMSLRDLPKPPEQGIFILSQRAAPPNVEPRRYGEGAPDQFSEIAVFRLPIRSHYR
jgi:hypothetical protein